MIKRIDLSAHRNRNARYVITVRKWSGQIETANADTECAALSLAVDIATCHPEAETIGVQDKETGRSWRVVDRVAVLSTPPEPLW